MTEPGDEFETFLKTRTLLPNGMSDDEKLEPPKALDASVLKEAREAIRARQQLNRTPRWATPVALAATILLCLSIVLNVSLNANRPVANLQPAARPPVVAEAAPAAAQPPVPSAAPRPDSPAADTADALANRTGTPMQALREATPRANSAAAPSADHGARSRQWAQGPSETAPAANSAAGRAPQVADRASTEAQAQGEPQSGANVPTDRTAQLAKSVTALAKRAQARPKAATATPPHPQDPKTWLQQIADLRAAGKTEQAEAEMRRFRVAFPGYSAKPTPAAPSEPPK